PVRRVCTGCVRVGDVDVEPPGAGAVIAGAPEALNLVLNRAMSKSPQDRYASAAEFLEDYRKTVKPLLKPAPESKDASAQARKLLSQTVQCPLCGHRNPVILMACRNCRASPLNSGER